ncbi:hypothetical protein [Methylocystis echinoides]|uniref:hypothetical protein n=1 Tax=Methylocystis echinoides TaxID=29468 RepID=UPI003420E924
MRQRRTQLEKRAAVMRAAWAHWRYVRMKGWHASDDEDPWTWARCVRFAAAQARARRPSGFAAVEAAMAALLAEGDLTGRHPN